MHPFSILEIRPSYKCNNLCAFCREGGARDFAPDMDAASVLRALKRNSGRFRTAVFSGGEPTLREDLPEMIEAARKAGFSTVIETNARRAAYRGYAELLAAARPDRIIVSLNGHCAALHDYLTRQPGSFAETVLGIAQLIAAGANVEARTVASRSGVYSLDRTAALAAKLGAKRFNIVFPTAPHGADEDFVRKNIPLVTIAAKCAVDAAARVNAPGMPVSLSGFPPCSLGKRAGDYSAGMPEDSRVSDSRGMAARRGGASGLKSRNCARCVHFDDCPGPPGEYAKVYSAKEFRPVI